MRGAVLCVTFWLAHATCAAVLLVPGNHSTLQAAVNAAETGDTILCSYVNDNAQVTVSDKTDLLIKGGEGTPWPSVDSGMSINGSTCTLERLVIRGRDGTAATSSSADGTSGSAALRVENSAVTMYECNVAGGEGGRGYIEYCGGFGGVPCDCSTGGNGGAAVVLVSSELDVTKSTIEGGSHGGGTAMCGYGSHGAAFELSRSAVLDTAEVSVNGLILSGGNIPREKCCARRRAAVVLKRTCMWGPGRDDGGIYLVTGRRIPARRFVPRGLAVGIVLQDREHLLP
jgi:hypothetical protein